MKILGVNGSPNKSGVTSNLLSQALNAAERRGAEIKTIRPNESPCKHCYDISGAKTYPCSHNEIRKLHDAVLSSDGIILATPVHWLNMSSSMKNFVDILTPLECSGFLMEGKVVGIIAVAQGEGSSQVAQNLACILNHMGCVIPPYAMIFYATQLSKKLRKDWVERDIELLGKNMVIACNLLKHIKPNNKPNWDYE